LASAEALQGLHLSTDQRATKIRVDHLQDGCEVETGNGLSCEEEEREKEKKYNVHIT